MSRTVNAVALVFISGISAESQTAVRGRVTDSEGAVIAKAFVLVHLDSSSPISNAKRNPIQDVNVVTDENGEYTAAVPAGFYDVFVSAPLFTPVAAKVIVKEHQRAKFDAKLYVDPQVSIGNRRDGSRRRAPEVDVEKSRFHSLTLRWG